MAELQACLLALAETCRVRWEQMMGGACPGRSCTEEAFSEGSGPKRGRSSRGQSVSKQRNMVSGPEVNWGL